MGKSKRSSEKTLNVTELRNILSEEIQQLRSKKTSPAHVNAVCNATGKILQTVKLEMMYYKMLGKSPRIDFLGKGLLPSTR